MQPLPDIAGAVSAAAGSNQMIAGAVSSSLVAVLFDGRSALSMAAVMAASSLLALTAYWLLARPAERDDNSAGRLGTQSASGVTRSVTHPN
jgi:DHA1 family bicyclomycin/chloramphenicol resistance-like MFS transporter